jgi:hypothetical protein
VTPEEIDAIVSSIVTQVYRLPPRAVGYLRECRGWTYSMHIGDESAPCRLAIAVQDDGGLYISLFAPDGDLLWQQGITP